LGFVTHFGQSDDAGRDEKSFHGQILAELVQRFFGA
jgi:hypothetical protein